MKMILKRCFPSLCLMPISQIVLLVVVLCIGQTLPALGNGGKSKLEVYMSREIDGISLLALVEPVLFSLNTAGNKYKVIHLRVTNDTGKPLLLSAKNDAIEIIFEDQKVNGILDLFRQDPAFWDTLEPEMRKVLAYPEKVFPHEEESVFIFIPKATPAKLLERLHYKINSLSRELILAPPAARS